MVVAQKPNDLRICLDPTRLNRGILWGQQQTKRAKEVVATMPNAKVFSVFDAQSGYWQISLDEKSYKLCTFNTPWG